MIRLSDLTPLVCGLETPITQALSRLAETPYLFQLIVDENGRLVGTFTDSDMRRAILRGVPVDAPVRRCMHESPIVGRAGQDGDNLERLATIPGLVAFLPVLDEAGRVAEVLIAKPGVRTTPALIMAGGLGSRFGDLTASKPKPLLDIAGRPILDHILERLENDGIRSIYVSVHYLADQIEHFIAGRENRADVVLLREDRPLGTAGALARLHDEPEGDVLVINGDLVTQTDFHALETFHHRHGHDATISVASYEFTIPYGVVQHGEDGQFHGIQEKPRQTFFVAAGIYMVSSKVAALVPPDEAIDMPELLNRARNSGLSIGVFPVHEYWRDVGHPADLARADRDVADNGGIKGE